MSDRVRIVLTINNLERGGAQNLVTNHLRYANRDRFEYSVLSLGPPYDLRDAITDLGYPVDVVRVGMNYPKKQIMELRLFLKSLGSCIVHAHTDLAAFATRAAGIDVQGIQHIAHFHSVYERRFCDAYRSLEERLGAFTARYVACSRNVESFLADRVGTEDSKTQTVENGINLSLFNKSEEDRQLLRKKLGFKSEEVNLIHVSRLISTKRPERVVRALSQLPENLPWRLRFLGEGDYRPNLESAINQAPKWVAERVELLGNQSNVADWLAASDVFVSFSEVEGLPISVIEAMASGLPCIVSDIPAIKGVVTDETNGFVCGIDDDSREVEALRDLIENREQRTTFGEASRQNAQQFRIESYVERIEDVYSSLNATIDSEATLGFLKQRSLINQSLADITEIIRVHRQAKAATK